MRRSINFVCYTTMILLGLYLAGYQNVIDSITGEYSIASSVMGIIIALHFTGSITAPVIFGEISDRKGSKVIILVALFILISGLLAASVFQNIYVLALGIFLVGSGFSVIEGTLSAVLSNINPGETVKVINLSQMYFCIGAVLGPLITLFIINQFGSWRILFVLLIFLFLLIIFLFSRFDLGKVEGGTVTEKCLTLNENEGKIHSIALLKSKSFLLLCIAMFLYVGAEEGIAFWTTTFFKHAYNNIVWGSYALSGYWTGMILGRFLAGIFPKKGIMFLFIGTFLSIASIILALLVKSEIIGFISFSLIGLGFSVAWPMIISITSDKFSKYKGTAVGIMMSLGAAGGMVIPLLIGLFDNIDRIKQAFWMFPVFAIIILLAVLKSEKMEV
ncbi:MAG: MFS transporter [Caldicoprobacterales bacterium]|jgi:FHS family glucose/mannose:H+ symporter-like MFS transporter